MAPINRSPFAQPNVYEDMRVNLRRLYGNATQAERRAGAEWYPAARRIVAEWAKTYQQTTETVACVIAALSPQVDWPRNLIQADDVLADRPLSIGGLRKNEAKARQLALSAGTLGDMLALFPCGPKVNAFAANLAGDNWIVTIDTHAAQAANNVPTTVYKLGWSAYTAVATAYAHTASDAGIPWCDFQATIWLVWKRLHSPEQKRALIRERKTS